MKVESSGPRKQKHFGIFLPKELWGSGCWSSSRDCWVRRLKKDLPNAAEPLDMISGSEYRRSKTLWLKIQS